MKASLVALGYEVFTIPELPTLLMSNGALYPGNEENKHRELLEYESEVLKFQLSTEETFRKLASISDKPSIIICDRGAMDVAAYIPEKLFNDVLGTLSITRATLLNRYDIVCHLVTTADGAEDFYTNSNNAIRLETAEQARALDMKTRSCWNDHSRFHIVPNTEGGFKTKLELATRIVVDFVQSNMN